MHYHVTRPLQHALDQSTKLTIIVLFVSIGIIIILFYFLRAYQCYADAICFVYGTGYMYTPRLHLLRSYVYG